VEEGMMGARGREFWHKNDDINEDRRSMYQYPFPKLRVVYLQ